MSNYNFDFGLGETIDMLRDSVRQFCLNEIAPIAADIDRSNSFPRFLWPKIGDLGLFGITVDSSLGGSGLGYLAHCIAMEEISRASPSVGLSYGAHSNLCVNQLQRFGNEDQKNRHLPALLTGAHVGALAMSEAGSGSDIMSMRLRAQDYGDSYILNGSKMWITNGTVADLLIVYATVDPSLGSKGVTAFLVEKDMAGFNPSEKLDKLGMRGSDTAELVFENVEIPKSHILGSVGEGASILMSGLDYERVVLAAGPLGIMQACIDLVVPYLHDREQFGRPIGTFELMQGKLADMYTQLSASRAYVYAVAQACDSGRTTRFDAAGCILFASERATKLAMETIQSLGGNGYINDYPAGRLLRDAKLYEIGAGTNEIRRMLIGRELFEATA